MSRATSLLLAATLACATAGERAPAPPPAAGAGPPVRAATTPLVGLPAPNDPTVAVRIEFLSGAVDDPPGKEGLTALTAAVMAEGGTEQLTAAELVRALYPMSAEIEVVPDKETTVFAARCTRQDLERLLPILEDVVRRPRLAPAEFERLRSRALDHVEKTLRTEDDEELGKAALALMLYQGHPYAHPTRGTVEGLRAITLDDVRAQWRRVFVSSRMVVGAAGAYDGDLPARIAGDLGGLPAGSVRAPVPAPPGGAPRFLVVDKATTPTAISMGFTWDVKRGDPDFPALVVAVAALGEHRQSSFRLYRALREIRGLNYGDYAYPEHFQQAGDSAMPAVNHPRTHQEFTVWIRPVEPPNRVFAIRAALYEIDRWVREGITQAELDDVRSFLAGYTLLFEQTDTRRLGNALDDRFYGLPAPWLRTLRQALPALTVDAVNAAIRRHVDPARLRIAVATHGAAELASELRSGARSPIAYAVAKPKAVLEADAVIERFPLGIARPADVQVARAQDLFQR